MIVCVSHVVMCRPRRGESDLKGVQETLKNANEMDAMFLEEMKQSIPHFRQLKAESELCF